MSWFCTKLIITEAFLSFCLLYSWTRLSRLQFLRNPWTCPCCRAICLWTKTIRKVIALIATGASAAVSIDNSYNQMFNYEATRVCFAHSLLRAVIGWQSPRHMFDQWETTPKPTVICLHAFSRACRITCISALGILIGPFHKFRLLWFSRGINCFWFKTA